MHYRSRPKPGPGTLVRLVGLHDRDGYNPSNPIPDGAHPYSYVRVEPRADELDSWSIPFRQRVPDEWEIDESLPKLRVQDPSVAVIKNELVVSGVRITDHTPNHATWETVFFRGSSPATLNEFAVSPPHMKDVRLIELQSGRVGIFTRPMGNVAGRGCVGYTEIDSIDELTTEVMARAEYLESQPIESQWWGVNAVFRLGSGLLGVLAHIAKFDGSSRHYYPVVFVFDPGRRTFVRDPEIIADRSCFPASGMKRPDLEDVVFPTWIDRERGLFFGGISDTRIGVLPLPDPFAGW
jgi:hypothetical protein